MQPLSLNEFRLLAKKTKKIAFFKEIPAGNLTPASIYQKLSDYYGAHGVMMENLATQQSSRYSSICFEAIASLSIKNGDNTDPLNALRNLQLEYTYSTREEVAERITSAMGLIGYDIVRYFENLPDQHVADPSLPILLFHFYAVSLSFDHDKQSLLVSTLIDVSDQPDEDYQKAEDKIARIIQLIAKEDQKTVFAAPTKAALTSVEVDISDDDFMHKVEKAKEYIIAGDAFQIVLSRCFKRTYSVTPLEIYQTLCRISPAPFMFYFPIEAGIILGASPERMVSVRKGEVTVNPIAGTRKRCDDATDNKIAEDLLSDKKELAEHMMLVDLARNDVGSVSKPGSVVLKELLNVKHFSHVSHITSTVSGTLQHTYDAFDAFRATFPAGTLTGAPKIRAMEIIDELETSRRGFYGGAICRIDALGNFDSCISIRMAVLKDGIATIRVGAGIVYDSNPALEARETQQKAQSMLHAIAAAHGDHYDTHH